MQYRILPSYTYNDYLEWEGQGHWELIDGIPWSMRSRFNPRHQAIAGGIAAELRNSIKKAGCKCKAYQPLDYRISDSTVFNPDVLVACKPITKKYLDFAPEIVVEILSESTFMKDRHIKFPRYEAKGIPYYLMVDLKKDSVEVHQLVDGHYEHQFMEQDKPFEFTIGDCRFEMIFNQIWE